MNSPLLLRAACSVARGRIRVVFTHRTNALAVAAGALLQIALVNAVWRSAYASAPTPPDRPLDSLLLYVTVAGLHAWLMSESVVMYMQVRVSQGTFVFDLLRPVGYLTQMAAQQAGFIGASLVLLLPALPVAVVLGTLSPPGSTAVAALYGVSLLLGLTVHTLLSLLIGLSGFWTIKTDSASLLYRVISQFLAGTFAPLSMFPGWLRAVAEVLPFQCTTYIPVEVYTGGAIDRSSLRAVGLQVCWAFLLTVTVYAVWRRAARKVVVQGG
ncbi:hypothetical protein G3I47_26245 [Streptomyces anulatus]|nr:hypothetical protein [Streptomyces anulatus]